ncbi:TauD/TfdA family dioxygenase [Streptomyces sp. NPDC006173]|uniref:TauD/TfdA dioxygenase family protein n=1 Tax=Streptomyces sp. NPDC006173 TaxID=3155349 RepID=UPI003405B2F8
MLEDLWQQFRKANLITYEITPIAPEMGAVIRDFRLSDDIAPAQLASIRSDLLKYKVLFFRDQQHLNAEMQQRLSRLFGEPFGQPEQSDLHTLIRSQDSFSPEGEKHSRNDKRFRNDVWHVDRVYLAAYPKIAILLALKVPNFGDTLWANTEIAYRNLPRPLRELAEKLRVRHSDALYQSAPDASHINSPAKHEVVHPMVIVHPETAERSLLVGNLAQRIEGLSSRESSALLNIFQSHIEQPEHVIRWSWREGDVAIWDARSTQHYAVDDYGTSTRCMRRILLQGDAPTGIDGNRSVQLPLE